MSSRGAQKVRVRRTAEDRRQEIVAGATRLSLRDGLEQVTLRRLAEELGIAGSLVSHYFPAIDDLLAEAFASAASDELTQTFALLDDVPDPVTALRTLLRSLVDESRDQLSTLWVDAWHAGRRRPALRTAVADLTREWNERVEVLVERGLAQGVFTTGHPRVAAARIMAVVDGLTVQGTVRGTIDYESVEELVFLVAESELGLRRGSLS
jgi:AcrR family transcriptional regulator